MKTTITIVGVGERRSGISQKNNRPYDFTPVAFTYDDPYIAGLKAATVNVAETTLAGYRPAIGDSVTAWVREDYETHRIYVDGFML